MRIKGVGAASLATLVVANGGTASAQTTEHATQTDAPSYTYTTQNSWGPITEWHDAADLSFTIDCGTGSAPASLTWHDQQGNSFAISFASDMSSFLGYFQRSNEGPIAYRGTQKEAAAACMPRVVRGVVTLGMHSTMWSLFFRNSHWMRLLLRDIAHPLAKP